METCMIRVRKRFELETDGHVELQQQVDNLRKRLRLKPGDLMDVEWVSGKLVARVTSVLSSSAVDISIGTLEPGVELLR
jgi:hypothetical protein